MNTSLRGVEFNCMAAMQCITVPTLYSVHCTVYITFFIYTAASPSLHWTGCILHLYCCYIFITKRRVDGRVNLYGDNRNRPHFLHDVPIFTPES